MTSPAIDIPEMLTLTITWNTKTGAVEVSGPLRSPPHALFMLEVARRQIMDYKDAP